MCLAVGWSNNKTFHSILILLLDSSYVRMHKYLALNSLAQSTLQKCKQKKEIGLICYHYRSQGDFLRKIISPKRVQCLINWALRARYNTNALAWELEHYRPDRITNVIGLLSMKKVQSAFGFCRRSNSRGGAVRIRRLLIGNPGLDLSTHSFDSFYILSFLVVEQ